jgi:hypothetical protein
MTRPALLAAITCLLLLAGQVRAELIPSFDLTYSAWHATHIVVADDKGAVLESWAGDLKPGDKVPIGDFRLPAELKVSRWAELGSPNKAKTPAHVPTRRVVLFLLKEGAKAAWQPAAMYGQYDISTAWIQGGKVYALQQFINPGPLELLPIAESEATFKKQVSAVRDRKAKLRAALAESDLGKRAVELRQFLGAGDPGRAEALRGLVACGKAGAEALAEILSRRGDAADKLSAVRGLVQIGRPAGGELIELLRTELGFWKAVAPDLPANWPGAGGIVADHLARLQAALASAQPYKGVSADQRRVIEETRKLWGENPVLRVKPRPGGHPAILADRILTSLNR